MVLITVHFFRSCKSSCTHNIQSLILCTLCPATMMAMVLLSTRDTCDPSHLQGLIRPRITCMNNSRTSSELWNSHSEDSMKTVQMALSVVQSCIGWVWKLIQFKTICPVLRMTRRDPTKLLDAFECYFKLERNIFQSWYVLGSIYSSAYKTQPEFYHKLNSVANGCNFTNKDEIVKFLYLPHNQNTRVHEHLLKELTDTTSLADML